MQCTTMSSKQITSYAKQVYGQKQRTMAELQRAFTRGLPKERVIVGYGAATAGHGSPIPRRYTLAISGVGT